MEILVLANLFQQRQPPDKPDGMVKELLWNLAFLIPLGVNAQLAETPEAFQQCFTDFHLTQFQEKIYLQTDKSHYTAGEHIWLRAYRTDATTHIPTLYSKFIYIELYNDREKLVERIKVREQDSCFSASFPLDPYLPSGRYCLRAYTYWMQNFDETFYFRKEITIENLQASHVRSEIN